jgi:hypothetical protein
MDFGVLSTTTLVTSLDEFLHTPLTKVLIYLLLACLLGELTDALTDKATNVTYSYNF